MSGAPLVVNADDLGVSRGATLGIVRAHREGIVSSASLATTMPGYEHALEACVRSCPDLGIGLHFTLTAGRPVSAAKDVPQLVGADGRFRWRFMPLLLATSTGSGELLTQVGMELEAQIQRLLADGVRPDHVNGERHVHLLPGIFERVVAAAKRHGIPYVRLGREVGLGAMRVADLPDVVLGGGFLKTGLLSTLSGLARGHLEGSGVKSAEHFASYAYSGRLDLVLKDVLARPPRDGVTEIMVHPGVPEESRDLDVGNEELARYVGSEDRRRELDACIAGRAWLEGWQLTTFGALARGGTRP